MYRALNVAVSRVQVDSPARVTVQAGIEQASRIGQGGTVGEGELRAGAAFSWLISPFLPPALLRRIGHAIEQRGKELVAQGLVLRIRREFPLVRWLIEQVGGGDRPAGGMQQGV